MPNCLIEFFPKRDIIASSPATDELYPINVDITTFDKSLDTRKKETTTLSGIRSVSLFYQANSISCETAPTDPDGTEAPTTEEIEMFLASVEGGEEFTVYNIDDDRTMTCQLTDRGSRSRFDAGILNKFVYTFTIRETTE